MARYYSEHHKVGMFLGDDISEILDVNVENDLMLQPIILLYMYEY